MSDPSQSSKVTVASHNILGREAFASISAVEGLTLTETSARRLDALCAAGLTPEERRQAVIRVYSDVKGC